MKQIAVYGLGLGLLLVLMQFGHYRFVLMQHAESVYTGLVALVCCIAGIWAGGKLARKWQGTQAETAPSVARETPLAAEEVRSKLRMSVREYEVLQLIARGLSNQEIAAQLFVSLNTVKTHTSNVFAKLEVQRRTQAIQKAKELGLL